jgi:hypothetical protein
MSGTSLPAGSTSGGTQTGAAAAAVTLTLAAPAAGLFQYITYIEITKTATALLTAAATPVLVTTTNIPGTPTIDWPADAALQGTQVVRQIAPAVPIKAVAAATAVTIVCPATTGVIWRVSAQYFIGP